MAWMGVDKAADQLGLKPETVRTWLRKGLLKGVKFGKVWKISEEEISRVLTEGTKSE